MVENSERISQLLDKLESLLKRQETLSKDLNEVRKEINILKTSIIKQAEVKEKPVEQRPQATREPLKVSAPIVNAPSRIKADLEKFIGENLINKIGIAITVISFTYFL